MAEIASPVAFSVSLGCVRPRVETIVPLATKMLAISRASSTRPPPLERRSNTIPLAPAFSSCSTAWRTSACAPGLNVASSTTPSFTPLTVRVSEATTGCEIVARVSVSLRVTAWPARRRRIPSRTSVPGGPLTSAIAASPGTPASLRPLTETITSPAFRCARAAGESSNTRAIRRPRGVGSTATPIPVKLGGWLNSRNSRGER